MSAGGEYGSSRVRVGAPFVGRSLLWRQFRSAAARPPVHLGNRLRARHHGYYRHGEPGELTDEPRNTLEQKVTNCYSLLILFLDGKQVYCYSHKHGKSLVFCSIGLLSAEGEPRRLDPEDEERTLWWHLQDLQVRRTLRIGYIGSESYKAIFVLK